MGEVLEECLHGITAAWCSICKEHRSKEDKKKRSAWVEQVKEAFRVEGDGVVRAQYDGRCAGPCGGNRIDVDDWIKFDEEVDGWVSMDCCGKRHER